MLRSVPAETHLFQELGLEFNLYPDPKGDSGSGVHIGAKKRAAVLMVHGRAGNETLMWVFSKAFQKQRPLVFAPRAILPDPVGGYSWWQVSQTAASGSASPRTTTLEDLDEPLDRLASFVELLPKHFPIDTQNIFAMGFSQGAALVTCLSLLQPQLFRGVAILSGFIPAAFLQAFHPPSQIQTEYFIGHGALDDVIPISKALAAKSALGSLGASVEFHQDEVTHKVGTRSIAALSEWFLRLMPEQDPHRR